ncbi:hypothetical protein K466DRAFT_654698 [Polyporus arcularius HHB13444]|uniref:Uncharacterized protein n=1 Tax=Polyporus arcularius HHB13444 TaxID=1314778 RepID=A0A5C3P6M6_9APHY|nr:hypothetical protein K466DRAFT_654698 [Polyporus arcularius HHB13444]
MAGVARGRTRGFETTVSIGQYSRTMFMTAALTPEADHALNLPAPLIASRSRSDNPYMGTRLVVAVDEVEWNHTFWTDKLIYQRYMYASADAQSLTNNPRNLEWYWKPVWRQIAYALIGDISSCDVQEEAVFWTFPDPRRNPGSLGNELAETMHLTSGSTLKPDLCIRDHMLHPFVPEMHADNIHRYTFLVIELKRAISRREAYSDGYPRTQAGYIELQERLERAAHEVQLQVMLMFKADSRYPLPQDGVILIAGSGKIFTWAVARRYNLPNTLADQAAERQVRQLMEEWAERNAREELRADVDPGPDRLDACPVDVPPLPLLRPQDSLKNLQWSVPVHVDHADGQANLAILRNGVASLRADMQVKLEEYLESRGLAARR